MKHLKGRLAGWGALVLTLVVFGLVAPPWMRQWGATEDEQSRPMAGDSILLPSGVAAPETRAIDVNAPASVTWEWLRRVGQGRGGFYSYDWLENLFGDDVHNRRDLFPAPPVAVGDTIKLAQDGYPGSRPGLTALPIAAVTPGYSFVLKGWGTFMVASTGPHSSRMIIRERPPVPTSAMEAVLRNLVWEPAHFVMERQMLRGVRDRAEGVREAGFGAVLATLGFLAAGVGAVTLLVWRRLHWWLLVPTAAAITVFATTGGLRATLAGFVALSVPGLVWAYLPRGRWLALLALLGAVLLIILAAADAYVAIGWLMGAVAGGGFFWYEIRGGTRVSLAGMPLGQSS